MTAKSCYFLTTMHERPPKPKNSHLVLLAKNQSGNNTSCLKFNRLCLAALLVFLVLYANFYQLLIWVILPQIQKS